MHCESFLTRRREAEEGFTLIELMVVVLIIAILITIAIPSFLGARRRAEDRAAESNLRTGLIQAKVVYTDHEDYSFATAPTLAANESSIKFVDQATSSTDPREVSVHPRTTDFVVLANHSKSGKCFYISDDVSLGGGGTRFYQDPAAAACNAGTAPAQGDPLWTTSW